MLKAFVLLLLTTVASSAQLLIYNFTAQEQLTGRGVDTVVRSSGTLVIDLITDTAVRLSRARVNGIRRFSISDEFDLIHVRARGPLGSSRSLFISGGSTNGPDGYIETGAHYSGKDAALDLGWYALTMPRSFKGAGYTFLAGDGFSGVIISTVTINHTFASRATIDANNAAETIEQAAERFRQLYLSQGYVE